MSLLLPFSARDPLLAEAGVTPETGSWPPATDSIPQRITHDDIPAEGSCEARRGAMERAEAGIAWKCSDDKTVDNGGSPNSERRSRAVVTLPHSARILDVRYFHRSRGDWRAPREEGPWMTAAPGVDLLWMSIDAADLRSNAYAQSVEAECRNWSHNLKMYCAIGVLYRSEAWLW